MPTDLDIIQRAADELPDGVWIARAPGGEFVYANHAFREIMGMTARDDVVSGEYAEPYGIRTLTGEPYPEDRMPFAQALAQQAKVVVDDIVIHRTDGVRVNIRAHAKPVFLAPGGPISHVVISFYDISREVESERQRVEAEARLAKAQRMESIGNMAGGVAHDFNNLLAVIRLLAGSLRRTERDPRRVEDLRSIDDVVDSAAALTRSLLSFAGRGPARADRVSVSMLAGSIVEIVSRAVDRRIEVIGDLRAGSDVIGDPSRLQQVVMNLVVNARDALPEGGTIAVRVYPVTLSGDEAAPLRLEPGAYVVIEVGDDGTGIDPAIRDRVFEPYFSTKTEGPIRGTGLGLATVFGIVEAHGGVIHLLDNVPRGTLARVHLPAAARAAELEDDTPKAAPPLSDRRMSVLVIEDEPLLRATVARGLTTLGHAVLSAEDGVEGVELFRAHHGSLDAVVLDMIMPRMGGRSTYRALAAIDPDVPVVLTTGYARNDESQAILDLGARALLDKPYSVADLTALLSPLVDAHRRLKASR